MNGWLKRLGLVAVCQCQLCAEVAMVVKGTKGHWHPRASSGKDRRLLIQLNKCLSPSEQLERQAEVHSCTQDILIKLKNSPLSDCSDGLECKHVLKCIKL